MCKISIITPIYGVEKYIEKSLESLMQQTYEEIEFILVNDCTTDLSMNIALKVIERYPSRRKHVKIINQPSNQGSGAARAAGINAATGEYTIQIDSDDYCEPEMIAKLYICAVESNADIVICDYYVNYNKYEIYKAQLSPIIGKECVASLLSGKLHSSTSNKLIRLKLYSENNINFIAGIDMWEDLTTITRLCYCAKKIVYLPEAFLHYMQINPQSYSTKLNERSIVNMKQSIDVIVNFLETHNGINQFKKEINFQKLSAKRDWLRNTRGEQQKELFNIYPESNKFLMTHPTLPIYDRYVLWIAIHNQYWLANIFMFAIDKLRKLRFRE